MTKSTAFIALSLCVSPLFSQTIKFGKVSKDDLAETVYAPDSTAQLLTFINTGTPISNITRVPG